MKALIAVALIAATLIAIALDSKAAAIFFGIMSMIAIPCAWSKS